MAVKRYNGTNWEVEAGSQGITYSATAPTVPAVGDIWVSTADVVTFDTTVQTGFRNVLINGGFAIDQRGFGSGRTIVAGDTIANGYTVDRWYSYCTGANVSTARVAGVAPSQFYYRFTGATSNTGVGFGQRIEANNSFHLAGQTVTLSVGLASTSLTAITWTAFYANTADTFGTLASPTRTQIATGTFAVTSTLGRKSATFVVPAAATTGIEIVFTGGALLGSQTLTYDDAQLELGSTATPFEQKPITTELALCQRYFYQFTTQNTGTIYNGAVNYLVVSGYFPTTMRVSPTIGNVTTSSVQYLIAAGTLTNTSSIITASSNPNGFYIVPTITGFSSNGYAVFFFLSGLTASAEL